MKRSTKYQAYNTQYSDKRFKISACVCASVANYPAIYSITTDLKLIKQNGTSFKIRHYAIANIKQIIIIQLFYML